MIDLLAIAGRLLASLVILAVGLYLANLTFDIITRSKPRRRFLGYKVWIVIITLIATIALQQIRTANVINNATSGQVEAAISRTHKTNALKWTNVAIGEVAMLQVSTSIRYNKTLFTSRLMSVVSIVGIKLSRAGFH